MTTQLSLANIISVSAVTPQTGANEYNTSNLADFTNEAPLAASATLMFSAVAASGAFTLTFGSAGTTSSISWNATAATIQGDINALTGLSSVQVSGSIASQSLTITYPGGNGALPAITVPTNSLETSGSASITVTPTVVSTGWSGGANGYAIYLSPTQVATDFGSTSRTAQMANAVFSQQPNVLANNGSFIAILMKNNTRTLTFSGVAASGAFTVEYNGNTSASIAWNATAAQMQTALQAVPGLSQVLVYGTVVSESVAVVMNGVYGVAPSAFTFPTNTLETSGSSSITITPADAGGESIGTAITRTQGVVQYFGAMTTITQAIIGQTDLLAAAAVIQALNVIGFFVSYSEADIESGGQLYLLQSGGFTQTRGLYYGDSSSGGINAVLFMAAYAGRGLSTNFQGSNTTQTMHLKQLNTIEPDPTITQTILNLAIAAGADTYCSFQGVPGVFCSGQNSYFDQVYNLQWFVGAIQVAGFNYLAQSATKIPQTESGMDGLKGAYRQICQQAVANQYLAPGTWTSSTTFGNPALLLSSVSQSGYYIYSYPISQQSQTARAARQAPLVQIAIKQAGAIQSSDVIIYVNA